MLKNIWGFLITIAVIINILAVANNFNEIQKLRERNNELNWEIKSAQNKIDFNSVPMDFTAKAVSIEAKPASIEAQSE